MTNRKPSAAAIRQAKSREARTKEGGRTVTVFVEAEASTKLDQWQKAGYGVTETINRVLRAARVAPAKKIRE